MPAMPSVTVRGSALAAAAPDRAELSLAIAHLAADPATALEEVSTRSQRLEQMLVALGIGRSE